MVRGEERHYGLQRRSYTRYITSPVTRQEVSCLTKFEPVTCYKLGEINSVVRARREDVLYKIVLGRAVSEVKSLPANFVDALLVSILTRNLVYGKSLI